MRDTNYAKLIAEADQNGHRIERIFVKEFAGEEIRFSWWKDGKMMMRPLDLSEEELLPLMIEAIQRKVFSDDFLKGLHSALYDARHAPSGD